MEAVEKNKDALARSLRTIGIVVVIASVMSFLFFGSSGAEDETRYVVFSIFSLFVGGASLYSGLIRSDKAGARSLLALATALLPVHSCVLGAFFYSVVAEAAFVGPSSLLWQTDSAWSAARLAMLGLPALCFLSLLAFRTFAAPAARTLSLFYLAANALVLLPFRGESTTLAVGIACLAIVSAADYYLRRFKVILDTKEGYISRLILWSPAVIITARGFLLYGFNPAHAFLLLGLLSFLSFEFSYLLSNIGRSYVRGISYILNGLAAVAFAAELQNSLPGMFAGSEVMSYSILFALGTLTYSLDPRTDSSLYYRVAMRIVCFGTILQFITSPGIIAALVLLLIGVALTSLGYSTENLEYRRFGFLAIAASLVYYMWFVSVHAFSMNIWMGFSCLGLALILLASNAEQVIEKFKTHFIGNKEPAKLA